MGRETEKNEERDTGRKTEKIRDRATGVETEKPGERAMGRETGDSPAMPREDYFGNGTQGFGKRDGQSRGAANAEGDAKGSAWDRGDCPGSGEPQGRSMAPDGARQPGGLDGEEGEPQNCGIAPDGARQPGGLDGEEEEEDWKQPELRLTKQESRWVALGALKAALLIGFVYLVGAAVLIIVLLAIWT